MIALRDVPELVAEITGETPALPTVYRWTKAGIAGVRLRTIYAVGKRRTCREWIEAFFEDVAIAKSGEQPVTRSDLNRRHNRAMAEIYSLGA